jgi:hypothetical protein
MLSQQLKNKSPGSRSIRRMGWDFREHLAQIFSRLFDLVVVPSPSFDEKEQIRVTSSDAHASSPSPFENRSPRKLVSSGTPVIDPGDLVNRVPFPSRTWIDTCGRRQLIRRCLVRIDRDKVSDKVSHCAAVRLARAFCNSIRREVARAQNDGVNGSRSVKSTARPEHTRASNRWKNRNPCEEFSTMHRLR